MDFERIKKLDDEYVLHTYARYPLALVKGKGCKVWDSKGKEYLDLIGGIASCPLGHGHPKLAKAIADQAKSLMHVSNLFYTEQQAKLAKLVNDLTPQKSKVFFCNSGTEANEAAIKVSRKHTGKREIIAMSNSFHGRTMGALAITDKKKYQKPFEPLMPETRIVPYGDFEALKSAVNDNTAAVFTELIQGEGGVKMPKETFKESREYFRDVRELCDKKDIVMVVDEVQTGAGRTGTFFASEQFGLKPDIITTAKGIAGGFPMGAAIIADEVASCIEAGDHASTFGGNPLACVAATTTIETILSEKLMENAKEMGEYLQKELGEVRGLGLLRGLEMGSADRAKAVMEALRKRGVLVNVTGNTVIRIVPPLVISKKELDFAVENLEEAAKEIG